MREETDAEYFRRRAQEQLNSAAVAADVSIKAIHLDLAARYATMAERGEAKPLTESEDQ